MDFKALATQIVMNKIGNANNSDDAASALGELAGGSGDFDLGAIVKQFQGQGGDLAARTRSWLGDGANESISATQIKEAIGSDKVAAFASKLGIDRDEASQSLANILPELIDKGSSAGNLLDAGNAKGLLAGLASRFFRKSA